jgi:hypothetical protein
LERIQKTYNGGQYYWEVCDSCLNDINNLNVILINNKWVKYSELTDTEKLEALKQNQIFLMQQIKHLNNFNQAQFENESSQKRIKELFKTNGYDLNSLDNLNKFKDLIKKISSEPPLNVLDFADIKKIIESNHHVKISEKISEIKDKDTVAFIEIPSNKNIDFTIDFQENIEKENKPKSIEFHFSINESLKDDELITDFLIFS